ncbi:histidine kinase [Streptomyces sp. NPDC047017]|uniref:sensor histidine kinase n=1 Tax=Streptomyces sp. NPDC047017 TaxID=3155024 RepID=UPI0033E15C34
MALRLARPHRDDVRIALAGLCGGLLLWGLGLGTRTPADPLVLWPGHWPLLLPLAVTAGCEVLRRVRPRSALLAGTAALAADTVTQGSLATVLMFTDLVYAAVLYASAATARRVLWAAGLVTVTGTLVPPAVWRVPEAVLVGVLVGIVTFGPAATGWIVRDHREAAAAARQRAEQTARLAELDRSQAVTAERVRMARELHDMVANHLSAIAVHSTAALSLDDPATTRRALTVIRENSVEGLAEMRRLIGILRAGSAAPAPAATPTLDGLDALVSGARAAGLDVVLRADHGAVPAPVELAAYRIVQESLTNALKHGSGGRTEVTVQEYGTALRVRVSSPYGDGGAPRAPGSGAGLIGMRERAVLLGGTFAAGPGDDRWTVCAALPLTESEAGSEPKPKPEPEPESGPEPEGGPAWPA